jgi:phosphatidylserine decarboxylase
MYFFRDPERAVPAGAGVISPADGRVVDVSQSVIDGETFWKISVFLSVFNVHVNRAPVGGIIRSQRYTAGRFVVASRPEASTENEQNTVAIETRTHDSVPTIIVFKQIAGLIARRIVFNKRVGDRVELGERVGLIKFGSRVDLFVPLTYTPTVATGDRVKGGLTWMAQPVATASGVAVGTKARESVEQLQSQ